MEVYNDIWVRGRVIEEGRRITAPRYEALRPLLSRYRRRFTVLDLGAALGYFGFRIADDYDAVSAMVDGGEELGRLCRVNSLPHTMFLHKTLSVDDLETLADCEHFDVVLALNILHHFPDWKRAADAVMRMGDHIVIETPAADETEACGYERIPGLYAHLESQEPKLLGTFPSHVSDAQRPLWLFDRAKTTLARPFIGCPDDAWDAPKACVGSSYGGKFAVFPDKDVHRLWIAGINLQTFWRLGGVYPSRRDVIEMLRGFPLPTEHHGDIRPWNFIFDGERIYLIDGRDEKANFDDAEGLAESIRMLEMTV